MLASKQEGSQAVGQPKAEKRSQNRSKPLTAGGAKGKGAGSAKPARLALGKPGPRGARVRLPEERDWASGNNQATARRDGVPVPE